MNEMNLRNYAHLGDAVWELFVREIVIDFCQKPKDLHKLTTQYVNAGFQASMLEKIESDLTFEEQDLKRRARNMPTPIARRSNQSEYRHATAFEALIGYWYRNDKDRLAKVFEGLKEFISMS
jgi:ribonuclease-3 family protein